MDPDVTLETIRVLADRILGGDGTEDDGEQLADAVNDLDTWLSKGGFLPARWRYGE